MGNGSLERFIYNKSIQMLDELLIGIARDISAGVNNNN